MKKNEERINKGLHLDDSLQFVYLFLCCFSKAPTILIMYELFFLCVLLALIYQVQQQNYYGLMQNI